MKTSNLKPTAKIAVKKSVLKEYKENDERVVYLDDGTEFEIELFNPTTQSVLAHVSLNGKEDESGGLVLFPGERVFLERTLDDRRKFKFITYKVDDIFESRNAIRNNGLIKVDFHNEQAYNITYISPTITYPNGTTIYSGGYMETSTTINYCNTGSFTFNTDAVSTAGSVFDLDLPDDNLLDTGVVDKGEDSDQEFLKYQGSFNIMPSMTAIIRILPASTKQQTIDDLKHRHYCPHCGAKVKVNHSFCAHCGEKL